MKLRRIISAFKRGFWKGSRLYDANSPTKRVSLYVIGCFWQAKYKYEVIEKTPHYYRSTLFDTFDLALAEFNIRSKHIND